jgi:thiol-disulfide isomerase/thioredoxin
MRHSVRRNIVLIAIVSVCALEWGCGGSSGGRNFAVGNMADTSYYGQRGRVSRPNAQGQKVALETFAGRFIWSEYAAPWCNPCTWQTKEFKNIDGEFGEKVVFLTVMTSDMGGYGDPATQATAANWASRFGLDPARVLAADLTSIKIPKHILFSPDGQVLFEKNGGMSSKEIEKTLYRYMNDWREWKKSGKRARWMRRG